MSMPLNQDPNADPMNIRNKKLNNPYIIAIFSMEDAGYFIDIQDGIFAVIKNLVHSKCSSFPIKCAFRLFQLPSKMSFIEVVDIFIKLHHVFNFEYAREFASLMHFFEYTLFDFEQSKRFLTPRLLEVSKEIKTTIYGKKETDAIETEVNKAAVAC